MIRLRGKHRNSARYYFDGHVYYNDGRGTSTIFRCASKNTTSCRAKIYVEDFHNLDEPNVVGQHNHDGDHLL